MLFTAQRPSPTVAVKRIFISVGLGALLFALINSAWSSQTMPNANSASQSIECIDSLIPASDHSSRLSGPMDDFRCGNILHESIVEGY